jgi:cell division protease FtsH
MVCKWGMSEKMGPISYHKSATSPFSGMGDNVDYSEKTAQEIDEEINRIVEKNYKQAINILKSNRDALDRLAQALVLWETIDLQQVKDVVAGNDIGLPLVRPQKIPTFNQTQAKAKEENNSETAPKEPVLA